MLSQMKNNRIEYSFQILQEYKEYYENLLRTGHSETAEETQLECKVEKEFQQISKRQGDKKERTTQNIIRKAIRKMTNKKAPDRLGCKTGWIKEGGQEMVKILYILFRRIKTENHIPKQWHLTAVKSVYNVRVRGTFKRIKVGCFW